jgi:hypothetical protein
LFSHILEDQFAIYTNFIETIEILGTIPTIIYGNNHHCVVEKKKKQPMELITRRGEIHMLDLLHLSQSNHCNTTRTPTSKTNIVCSSSSNICTTPGPSSFYRNPNKIEPPKKGPLKALSGCTLPAKHRRHLGDFQNPDAPIQPSNTPSLFESLGQIVSSQSSENLKTLLDRYPVSFTNLSVGDTAAFKSEFSTILNIEFSGRKLKQNGISIHACTIIRTNHKTEQGWLLKHSRFNGRSQKLKPAHNGNNVGKGAGQSKFVQQVLLVPATGTPVDMAMSTTEYIEHPPKSLTTEIDLARKFGIISGIQPYIINSLYGSETQGKCHKIGTTLSPKGIKSSVICKKTHGFMPLITSATNLLKCTDDNQKETFILNGLASLQHFAENNIIHGDLKLDNITSNGLFYDFGGSAINPTNKECTTYTPNYVSIYQWEKKQRGDYWHTLEDKYRQDSYGLAISIIKVFNPTIFEDVKLSIKSLLEGTNNFQIHINHIISTIKDAIQKTAFPIRNTREFKELLYDMTGTSLTSDYKSGENLYHSALAERINSFLTLENNSRREASSAKNFFSLFCAGSTTPKNGRRATPPLSDTK